MCLYHLQLLLVLSGWLVLSGIVWFTENVIKKESNPWLSRYFTENFDLKGPFKNDVTGRHRRGGCKKRETLCKHIVQNTMFCVT